MKKRETSNEGGARNSERGKGNIQQPMGEARSLKIEGFPREPRGTGIGYTRSARRATRERDGLNGFVPRVALADSGNPV